MRDNYIPVGRIHAPTLADDEGPPTDTFTESKYAFLAIFFGVIIIIGYDLLKT